jgi:alpha-D-ribose 1-methylphosphonate 5-triphosphate synthase subunit PhnG
MTGIAVLQQPAECVVAKDLDLMPVRVDGHAHLVGRDSKLSEHAAVFITTVQSSTARSS